MNRFSICLSALCTALMVNAQPGMVSGGSSGGSADTLRFTEEQASIYIESITTDTSLWRTRDEQLRSDLERLVLHAAEPFDSVRQRLSDMDLRSINVQRGTLTRSHEVEIRWLNDSTFIIDSIGWNIDLLTREVPVISYREAPEPRVQADTLPGLTVVADVPLLLPDTLLVADTVMVTTIDTSALESLDIALYSYRGKRIIPTLSDRRLRRSARIKPDSSSVVFTDTSLVWVADTASPFHVLDGPDQLSFLQEAMNSLLFFTERRDSTRLVLNDMYGRKTPFWVSGGSSDSYRFWVKNYRNDSITLWIGNPGRNEISLLLEDEIDVNRLSREEVPYLPRTLKEPPRVLKKIELLEPLPVFWETEVSSAFSFNQTYLSNWAKGGENSLSTILDVTGSATYNNTDAKAQWINSARINIGTLITQEHGLRKNNDLVEINSQFNRKAWSSQKLDLSASFYMKTQLARGYKYPDDSTVVSRFLNPGSLTIGLGIDYKPFKHTSFNLAPLSYKNTFVLDTARIDQTRHGVGADERSRQELGTQLVVRSKLSPMEDLTISNAVRLFSNYLNKPENIDVDWEMILDKKISWFFTVRLNLHLIYDDDIRFPVLGDNDEPVLLPDGSVKKVPKAQFKEFVGLSLLFRL